MSSKPELIQGPILPWAPSQADNELIDRLLASDNPLDNIYGQAYK
jgi:hypothetical protein